MCILGISSATRVVSLGLVDKGRVVAEATAADLRSEKILFYAKEAGINPEQISGVAVAAGPGSYSGLRGGAATAKSIALALNVPLAAVSTLEAVAYNLKDAAGIIAVVLEARLNEYNFALFSGGEGELIRQSGDELVKCQDIIDRLSGLSGDIWISGAVGDIKGKIRGGRGQNILYAEEIHSYPYGLSVAKIGAQKIARNQIEDPLTFAPWYSNTAGFKEYRAKRAG